MKPIDQIDRDSYRLIITRRNASEVLFTSTQPGLVLPRVKILPRSRIAEQLTTQVKSEWGLNTYCLFIPGLAAPSGTARRANYALMESIKQNDKPPSGMCWMPSAQCGHRPTDPLEDSCAIEESLRELDSYGVESKIRPFGRPGWLKDLFAWTQEQLKPLDLHLNGNFRQCNASPAFSLIRLETSNAAVWFKATGVPNLHELPITLCLARLFPENLPRIFGIHPFWNGWLSEEVSGTTLDKSSEISEWERAAEALAQLQIASTGEGRGLFGAQVKDLRLPKLIKFIPPFVSRVAELMAVQEKQPPPPLTAAELAFLGERLQRAFSVLGDLGFPDTLGHMDLNPGNIAISSARCVFLDWAEACVTNPLVTFEYLSEHGRRRHASDSTATARMATAYLRPWTSFLSPDDLARALAVSPLIAVFTYAVAISGEDSPGLFRNPTQSAYLRSLARRMHFEAIRQVQGETHATCNSTILDQAGVFQPPV